MNVLMYWGGLTLATTLTCDLWPAGVLPSDGKPHLPSSLHSSLSFPHTHAHSQQPCITPQQYLVLLGTCTWRCAQIPQPAPCQLGSAHHPTWGWAPVKVPEANLLGEQEGKVVRGFVMIFMLSFSMHWWQEKMNLDDRELFEYSMLIILLFITWIFLLVYIYKWQNRPKYVSGIDTKGNSPSSLLERLFHPLGWYLSCTFLLMPEKWPYLQGEGSSGLQGTKF